MTFRLRRSLSSLLGLLVAALLVGSGPSGARESSSHSSLVTHDFVPQAQTVGTHRVNAPYGVSAPEAAVFWFGRVTPVQNWADVRVRYSGASLWMRVSTFDRRLWYDTSPSAETLTDWDSVSWYLDTGSGIYRFDAQLNWWGDRSDWQAAYRLGGDNWMLVDTPFATASNWKGNGPNDDKDDKGWWVIFDVPFGSLGLEEPSAGSVWRMAVALHDRDDRTGTGIPDQTWPDGMTQDPATWAELGFGGPTYKPPDVIHGGTVAVPDGMDADVGGSSTCGELAKADNYFPSWGDLNYAGKDFVNIQNQADISDWPCFSRYYVTFPLDAVPQDEAIISATLTLHHWGNAGIGWPEKPQPSFIQALTIGEGWEEDTITWNNAPFAVENISGTWVEPVRERAEDPGRPYEWDVSGAVAEAYAKGEPVRLALYEADYAIHSGKYFHSFDYWSTEGRPALSVTWGRAVAEPDKVAAPSSGDQGTPVAYTVSFLGSGNTLTLTDTLPVGVGAPDNIELGGTDASEVAYDSSQHQLTWSDTPSRGDEVTIQYTAVITTGGSEALVNTVELTEAGGKPGAATTIVIANPKLVYLPLVLREN